MNAEGPFADSHFFTHEAMHTTFSLRLRGMDAQSASGMAREWGDRLDLLENQLSRFVEGGDVSRINQMQAGETLYVSDACYQCLLLAMDACTATGGLFDITLGTHIEHRKSGSDDPEPPLTGSLTIHPDIPAITCSAPGRVIDLGGIGKGFALDQARQLLTDWGAEDALLTAGASSMLAFGPQTWPVDLSGTGETRRIGLHNQSLSASGTGIQGSHIIHPAGPQAMPPKPCDRLWVTASSAALAEVWSTALMLVETREIRDFLADSPPVDQVFIDRGGRIESLHS